MKKNGRTQKEIKPLIKAEVDAFIVELANRYPEIATSSSLERFVGEETQRAFYELATFGKIFTNKERWGN